MMTYSMWSKSAIGSSTMYCLESSIPLVLSRTFPMGMPFGNWSPIPLVTTRSPGLGRVV